MSFQNAAATSVNRSNWGRLQLFFLWCCCAFVKHSTYFQIILRHGFQILFVQMTANEQRMCVSSRSRSASTTLHPGVLQRPEMTDLALPVAAFAERGNAIHEILLDFPVCDPLDSAPLLIFFPRACEGRALLCLGVSGSNVA